MDAGFLNCHKTNEFARSLSTRNNLSKYISALFWIVALIGLVTLLTGLSSSTSIINRFLVVAYCCVVLYLLLKKIKLAMAIFLLLLVSLVFVDLVVTGRSLLHLNDIFYLPLWCINLVFYSEYYHEIRQLVFKKHKIFGFFAFVWIALVLFSLLLPKSFIMSNNIKSFVSFTGSAHRFAQTALLAITCLIVEFLATKKKVFFILLSAPLIFIFYCGARTYLIVALFLVLYSFLCILPNKMAKVFFLLAGLILVIYAGFYTTAKRMGTESYAWQIAKYGTLHFLTSGRSDFWEIDLYHFFLSPPFFIVVGRGYNFVYDVNATYYNSAIWAHNDYINVLVSNGFAGIVLYFLPFFSLLKIMIKNKKRAFLATSFLLVIIVFNASFNMVYSYTVANLITPIIGIVLFDFTTMFYSKNNKTATKDNKYVF